MISAFNTALSALRAFSIKLDVNANNIANVNTDGFKKNRVTLQEAAPGGVTVTIEQVSTQGIPLGANEKTGEALETSNVDIAEEVIDQMVTEYAIKANVITVKTAEETQEALLDIIS